MIPNKPKRRRIQSGGIITAAQCLLPERCPDTGLYTSVQLRRHNFQDHDWLLHWTRDIGASYQLLLWKTYTLSINTFWIVNMANYFYLYLLVNIFNRNKLPWAISHWNLWYYILIYITLNRSIIYWSLYYSQCSHENCSNQYIWFQ